MTVPVLIDVAVGLAAGALAGALFFGGLRWTLGRLQASRRPLLLASVSLILRALGLAAVLVIASDGRFLRIAIALVAIIAVRTVMVRRAEIEEDRGEMSWT